jgi:hypothetical protein
VKQVSGTGFQPRRPLRSCQVYRRRFRLQYHAGNQEIEVDLWGTCIPIWVKFRLFSRRKGHPSNIHSKSQWMSMANPVAVLKRLYSGAFLTCASLVDRECRAQIFRPFLNKWLLGGPRDPKPKGGGPTAYFVVERLWVYILVIKRHDALGKETKNSW